MFQECVEGLRSEVYSLVGEHCFVMVVVKLVFFLRRISFGRFFCLFWSSVVVLVQIVFFNFMLHWYSLVQPDAFSLSFTFFLVELLGNKTALEDHPMLCFLPLHHSITCASSCY